MCIYYNELRYFPSDLGWKYLVNAGRYSIAICYYIERQIWSAIQLNYTVYKPEGFFILKNH